MSKFEYVMIPFGIVIGLAVAHLLAGLGKSCIASPNQKILSR